MRKNSVIISNIIISVFICFSQLTFASDKFSKERVDEFFISHQEAWQILDFEYVKTYDNNALIEVHFIKPKSDRWGEASGQEIIDFMRILKKFRKGKRIMHDQYQNIRIKIRGKKATIKAVRYNPFFCYKDKSYYLKIKLNRHGKIKIVEERFSFLEIPPCIQNLKEYTLN